jgi:AcrR family transcriptional regulator
VTLVTETSTKDRTEEHDELRETILETSMEILREDGREELSLRRIADLSGTSTQMIYTIFGGKDELVEEIYKDGSERLLDRFKTVSADNPLRKLYRMGQEYRNYALENRALYEAMYSSRISENEIVRKTEVFNLFKSAIQDCFNEEILTLRDPATITESFWAAAHGAISLEISGYYDSSDHAREAYDEVIRSVFDGFRVNDPTQLENE